MKIFLSFFLMIFMLPFFVHDIGHADDFSLYEEYRPESEQNIPEQDNSASENPIKTEHPATTENSIKTENQTKEENSVFILTDEKHNRFLLNNQEYALADRLLNQTWKLLKKNLPKNEYRALWQEQKKWLETGRNDFVKIFQTSPVPIAEETAFMLAAVVRTQELALHVWQEPWLGKYGKDNVFVTITQENGSTFIQGYDNRDLTDNTKAENNKNMPITARFKAELIPSTPCWLDLQTENGQRIYLLSLKNSLCIVHEKNAFPVDFNGVYRLK